MQAESIRFRAILVAIVLGLMIRAFSGASPRVSLSSSTLDGSSQAIDTANVEFAKAIAAVREAEAAGAGEDQLGALVERLNTVALMIDRAASLLFQGDIQGATAQAERSIEASREIVSQAAKLRDEASLRTYYGRVFTFGMVQVASLLVTAGAHFGWKWWRRREIDRTMRMEIRGVKEPREEE